MTTPSDEYFESYIPVYDTMPEKWDSARQALVEYLKKVSNAVNVREIGWFLEQELLSGKQFFPSASSGTFRSIFRTVVDFSPLGIGTTQVAHGINIDANFSLIDLWGSGTNAVAKTGSPINQPNIYYDQTYIYIVSGVAYTRCYAFMEYIKEI